MTIQEIAERAGVAKSTVSLVINGKPGVSPDTAAAVMKVIQETNYKPLKAAKTLNSGATLQIGFMNLVQSTGEAKIDHYSYDTLIPTFAYDVARGIEAEAQDRGYGLLFSTQHNGQDLNRSNTPKMISEAWIDGLLLVGGGFSDQFVSRLLRWKLPVVAIGANYSDINVDSVYADGLSGTRSAVQYLLEAGHREIAFIDGPETWRTNVDKKQGYISALLEVGLEFDPDLIEVGDYSAQSGYLCMHRLLERRPSLSAVCIALDGMALGAKKCLSENGLRIPHDISLVGFEDSWIATHFEPPLSTIRVDKHEMGVVGARRLFELLSLSRRRSATKSIVPTELVVRESTRRR